MNATLERTVQQNKKKESMTEYMFRIAACTRIWFWWQAHLHLKCPEVKTRQPRKCQLYELVVNKNM